LSVLNPVQRTNELADNGDFLLDDLGN